MAEHNGNIGGFYFDANVFGEYMQEQSLFNDKILASGIVQFSPVIQGAVGQNGNIGTMPFFTSIDLEPDASNFDGVENNTPTQLKGGKQTFIATARMKAWKEGDIIAYLVGKSPLTNLANRLLKPYYQREWTKVLLAIMEGVLANDKLKTHSVDLCGAVASAQDIKPANCIALDTGLEVGQMALGDNRHAFSLFICHSKVATNLRKMQLLENAKYYVDVLGKEISVELYNGMIVFETDLGTVDVSGAVPKYTSYMAGRGAFLGASKQIANPYHVSYDAETNGGITALYTKQACVLHPNGMSVVVNNIAKESPTNAELKAKANWEMAFGNDKLIALAKIVSLG